MGSYYLQDSRSYVGNDMLWWRKGCHGYTTNVNEAHVFTLKEANEHQASRRTDIPWPKHYIDNRLTSVCDAQNVSHDKARKNTKIVMQPPPKTQPKPRYNCCHCGKFVSETDYYQTVYHGEPCSKCASIILDGIMNGTIVMAKKVY
jgi:hypothetical protein